jgi:hypothetical protein
MMEQSILLPQNIIIHTEHCKRVAFYSEGPVFKSQPDELAILTETFGFIQSLQENAGIVPQINPQLLNFKPFPIHY